MPKLRTSVESFMDAQRHITIGRARLDKDNYNQTIGKKLDSIMTLLTEVIASAEKEVKSTLLNRDLFSAATKIEKELERSNIKTDYLPIVREIYAVNNPQKALKIGLQHGIERDQIVQLMARAPIHTNLGKVMRELKAQQEAERANKQVKPVAVVQPQVFDDEEPDITNDSDVTDDSLKQLLGVGE